MLIVVRTSANDGWLYAGMQNTDIGLASLVNCPVCPVTVGENVKCGPARLRRWSLAGPCHILGLLGWVSLGRAGFYARSQQIGQSTKCLVELVVGRLACQQNIHESALRIWD